MDLCRDVRPHKGRSCDPAASTLPCGPRLKFVMCLSMERQLEPWLKLVAVSALARKTLWQIPRLQPVTLGWRFSSIISANVVIQMSSNIPPRDFQNVKVSQLLLHQRERKPDGHEKTHVMKLVCTTPRNKCKGNFTRLPASPDDCPHIGRTISRQTYSVKLIIDCQRKVWNEKHSPNVRWLWSHSKRRFSAVLWNPQTSIRKSQWRVKFEIRNNMLCTRVVAWRPRGQNKGRGTNNKRRSSMEASDEVRVPVWTVVKNRTMVKRRLGQRLAHEGALGKVPASASNIDLRLSAWLCVTAFAQSGEAKRVKTKRLVWTLNFERSEFERRGERWGSRCSGFIPDSGDESEFIMRKDWAWSAELIFWKNSHSRFGFLHDSIPTRWNTAPVDALLKCQIVSWDFWYRQRWGLTEIGRSRRSHPRALQPTVSP